MSSEIEIQPGNILSVFSKTESEELHEQWMKVFGKNKQGLNTKSYKWHIFSGNGYPSLNGEKAFEKYSEQVSPEFVVMPNDNENAILTDSLPTQSNLWDFYVFPRNLAWTMAFTHEVGLYGPYFAKHKKYDELNAENIRQIEKNRQRQIAKEKGWSK